VIVGRGAGARDIVGLFIAQVGRGEEVESGSDNIGIEVRESVVV
jgi:hypothetical protein